MAENVAEKSRHHHLFKDAQVTSGVIWQQMLLYVLPLMGGSLFQQLYSTIDAVILGQFVSSTALGAVDSTFVVVRLFVNLFIGLTTGCSIVIAQLWGGHRDREVGLAVHTGIAFAVTGGALLTVLGVTLSPAILRLLDTPPENWDYAVTFIRIYFCGMIPMLTYNMCASILRAVGDSRRPFYFLVLSCVINIVLDLIFVPLLGWGVAGTALATLLAQVSSAAFTMRALMRETSAYRLVLRQVRFHKPTLMRMIALGLPTGIQSALYPISNSVIQWGINGLGSEAVTGWALTGKIDMFIWLVLDSFGVAITTFVAQNFGAGQYRRARRCVVVCCLLSLSMVLPLSAVMYFFGGYIALLFTSDQVALDECLHFIALLAPLYFTFIPVEVLSGAIRGTGETVKPMIVVLLGTCVLRIVWILAVVPIHRDPLTVAAAFPISWVITSTVFILYYRFGGWRKRLYVEEPAQAQQAEAR